MAEKNSEKTFSFYLDEIAKKAEYLEDYPDDSVSKNASNIKNDILELRKGFKGIKLTLVFFGSISVICLVLAGFTITNSKFRNFIANDSQSLKDSLLDVYGNEKPLTYLTRNNKIVTYDNLVKENDTLIDRYFQYRSDLAVLKTDLDLCELKLKMSKSEAERNEKNSNFYEDLNTKRQQEDLKELSQSIQSLKKVDSGKILLNVFRKSMKYDPKTKVWTIDLNKK